MSLAPECPNCIGVVLRPCMDPIHTLTLDGSGALTVVNGPRPSYCINCDTCFYTDHDRFRVVMHQRVVRSLHREGVKPPDQRPDQGI